MPQAIRQAIQIANDGSSASVLRKFNVLTSPRHVIKASSVMASRQLPTQSVHDIVGACCILLSTSAPFLVVASTQAYKYCGVVEGQICRSLHAEGPRLIESMSVAWMVWVLFVGAPRSIVAGTFLELATVDLSGPSAARRGLSLLAAFRETGAAAIMGHGVDVDATLAAAKDLFARTASVVKDSLSSGASQRGFIGRGAESGGGGVEAKEGFAYGARAPVAVTPLSRENKWPPECSARATLEAAHANLTATAKLLVEARATQGCFTLT